MLSKASGLGWLRLGGGAREIGIALGRMGREAVHRHLLPAAIWQRVTGAQHAGRVARMAASVQQRFPRIWQELDGLAEGLGLPLDQVFAWNCRGDLLASVPDGCTTVLLPGPRPVLAHNEDGLPFFRGACFIADVAPDDAPGFRAFCYPGSIPGHTFAFTDTGLVQTVNNLRLTGVEPDMPRMVLGRAALAAATLDEVLAILRAGAGSGGFHFGLSHRRDRRILSVEYGEGEVSVQELTRPAIHANHALHHGQGLKGQIITRSSADRQARGEALLNTGTAPLAILWDQGGDGLPVWRQEPEDPDDENTLATVLLAIGEEGMEWSIHDGRHGTPAYSGTTA